MNNNLISRSALLEQVRFSLPIDSERRRVIADCVEITRRLITEAPAVDAVEVVRCKDCKHSFEDDFDGSWWCCRDAEREVIESHFCSYGERRADE